MENSLKIKDIPKNERPKEKLLSYGADTLNNSELLAIILRTGTKGENVLQLSNRLLSEFQGLDGILEASLEDITSIKGIKEGKASQILALAELFKRFRTFKSADRDIKIMSPNDIAMLINGEMSLLKQEILKVIFLNTKNIVIGTKDVFKGSLNTSIVHPREIFKEAVNKSSAKIIICHNHPSGDPTPSKEDINITLRIKECGEIMGIQLLDHIIIGKNGFISLKEKGFI
ncbi:JAB domain-containing protein [Clostridium botulinum]|uniref:RadC family protein n=1 Tax=Clostridium botulinum TaxID=1491 RepID=UPI00077498A0|nr:DNA repair protein RadC [Clostridium botulinum]MBN1063802.1 JAB domain-containing protein [Clostridium botulinum]MBN1070041.1 JAB domain-containing protein [Clostridium botulinum]MBN1073204.1 JAB domain-containing protein [Clostridium botulinum]MBN1076541.1 JAB domain-containing protein [Clostridium botulinum]NFH79603.1 JAB domain-containing protein [Clostridium botulinum]